MRSFAEANKRFARLSANAPLAYSEELQHLCQKGESTIAALENSPRPVTPGCGMSSGISTLT